MRQIYLTKPRFLILRQLRGITQHSQLGIPTISIVFGSSTAGGAYIPGMSDYVIMVKDEAKVFLAGPIGKNRLDEVTDEESLEEKRKCIAPFRALAQLHGRISGWNKAGAQKLLRT